LTFFEAGGTHSTCHESLYYPWKIQYVNESYETHHDNDDTNVITNDATSINNEKRPETTPQNQHSSTKLLKFNHRARRYSNL